MEITKKDYSIAFWAGVLTGLFAVPILLNVGVREPLAFLMVIGGVPFLWVAGVWFGGFLSRWLPFMAQFGKYAAVGFLNASIDFGILNAISMATGVTAGFVVGGVNIPGFSVAVFNSYLWNRLWTFRQPEGEGLFDDVPKFLLVTGIGLAINSGVVVLLTTYVTPFFGITSVAWLNVAKVIASATSLLWNFLGYKFVVFKDEQRIVPKVQAQ